MGRDEFGSDPVDQTVARRVGQGPDLVRVPDRVERSADGVVFGVSDDGERREGRKGGEARDLGLFVRPGDGLGQGSTCLGVGRASESCRGDWEGDMSVRAEDRRELTRASTHERDELTEMLPPPQPDLGPQDPIRLVQLIALGPAEVGEGDPVVDQQDDRMVRPLCPGGDGTVGLGRDVVDRLDHDAEVVLGRVESQERLHGTQADRQLEYDGLLLWRARHPATGTARWVDGRGKAVRAHLVATE